MVTLWDLPHFPFSMPRALPYTLGADLYITIRQSLSLGLVVDLIIGLNYALLWNSIRHVPPCHGFMVGSVPLPSAFGLDHVSCLGQWGDIRQDASRDWNVFVWLDLLSCVFVIAMTYTCPGSPAGPKRMRDTWNWPEPSFQPGVECSLDHLSITAILYLYSL